LDERWLRRSRECPPLSADDRGGRAEVGFLAERGALRKDTDLLWPTLQHFFLLPARGARLAATKIGGARKDLGRLKLALRGTWVVISSPAQLEERGIMRIKLTTVAALMGVTAAFATGASGAAAAGGNDKPSALDEQWLTTSLQGDLFEVKGGKSAQQKGTGSAVKQLGARLASDHSKSFKDGSKLATSLGIEVPKAPTYPQKWELSQVGSLTGAAFDQGYTSLEALDHMQDIKDAKGEIADGSSEAVISIAKQDLKMYQDHLALVKKAQQQL
jgi:putative membrane protein